MGHSGESRTYGVVLILRTGENSGPNLRRDFVGDKKNVRGKRDHAAPHVLDFS
jgi:hypothetical protein